MPNDFFNELKKLFEKLPGIGPRQASRFIWAMVDFSDGERKKMAELINSLDSHLSRCGECLRIFTPPQPPPYQGGEALRREVCSFCQENSKRDHSKIMVVERDSDLINIEKSGIYKGLYHVLGGVVDPLEENQRAREGIKKLHERFPNEPKAQVLQDLAQSRHGGTSRAIPQQRDMRVFAKPGAEAKEIILALSPTKLGEYTNNYIIKILEPLKKIKISRLARGLSTGTDLEYADETTLRQALDNRK